MYRLAAFAGADFCKQLGIHETLNFTHKSPIMDYLLTNPSCIKLTYDLIKSISLEDVFALHLSGIQYAKSFVIKSKEFNTRMSKYGNRIVTMKTLNFNNVDNIILLFLMIDDVEMYYQNKELTYPFPKEYMLKVLLYIYDNRIMFDKIGIIFDIFCIHHDVEINMDDLLQQYLYPRSMKSARKN